MRYIVDVNGERITVDLDGGGAVVAGERLETSLSSIAGTPVHLVRVGAQVHRVVARRGDNRGRWTLDVNGVRVEADALDERMRAIRDMSAATGAASGPAPLVAPMPGLVVRIGVAVGDAVVVGQGLVVIEAMKMENELRTTTSGIVAGIRVAAGAVVEKGAVLVDLVPVPG